jgi:hypothetical protein
VDLDHALSESILFEESHAHLKVKLGIPKCSDAEDFD